MKAMAISSLMAAFVVAVAAVAVSGQAPYVVSVDPQQNATDAPDDGMLSVYFDQSMDNTSVVWSDNTFCTGTLTGRHRRTSYGMTDSPFSHWYYFDPYGTFMPGEVVTVALSDNMLSAAMVPLAQGYTWSYTVGVSGGSGVFDRSLSVSVGATPATLTVADVNSDGSLDVIFCNRAINLITILTGNGDGTLGPGVEHAAGNGPLGICAANLNNDTLLDLAVANFFSTDLSLYFNNGDGTFGVTDNDSVGASPSGVCSADLDADGDMDLATANLSGSVTVLLNDGLGVFLSRQDFEIGGAFAVQAADFDGDYSVDLAVAQWFDPPDTISWVTVLFNDGHGNLGSAQSYHTDLGAGALFAGDLDEDQDIDLAVTAYHEAGLCLLFNDGAGSFAPRVAYATGSGPYSVCGGDFDADADLDLAVANYEGNSIAMLRNQGAGQFALGGTYPLTGRAVSVGAGDFDTDGDLDLVSTVSTTNVTILYNNENAQAVDDTDPGQLPNRWELAQNYPNPFNPGTTIEYTIPSRTLVRVEVFNLIGQRVRLLLDEEQPAGTHRLDWNGIDDAGRSVATGMYLCRLKAGEFAQARKMLLVK